MTKIKTIIKSTKEKFIQLFGRIFFHDILSLTMIVVGVILLLALFLIIFFRIKSTDVMVPLYYNSIYGVTSSVVWYKLYFLPFSYLIIMALNVFIAWAFFDRERLLTYLVLFVNIIIGLILIIMEFNLTNLVRG